MTRYWMQFAIIVDIVAQLYCVYWRARRCTILETILPSSLKMILPWLRWYSNDSTQLLAQMNPSWLNIALIQVTVTLCYISMYCTTFLVHWTVLQHCNKFSELRSYLEKNSLQCEDFILGPFFNLDDHFSKNEKQWLGFKSLEVLLVIHIVTPNKQVSSFTINLSDHFYICYIL